MMLFVDIESTCANPRHVLPIEEQEVIEIGAVLASHGKVTAERQIMVKPKMHPALSDFCVELTGIRQADLRDAPHFAEAWRLFLEWLDGRATRWASWGKFDPRLLAIECARVGRSTGLPQHTDMAAVFSRATGKRRGRRRAMAHLGIRSTGQNHRGLDDAHDVFVLYREMDRRGWLGRKGDK